MQTELVGMWSVFQAWSQMLDNEIFIRLTVTNERVELLITIYLLLSDQPQADFMCKHIYFDFILVLKVEDS